MSRPFAPIVVALLLSSCIVLAADPGPTPLDRSVEQLRHVVGTWEVTTDFLDEDGTIRRSVAGTYTFDWVVRDRVVQGRSELPALGQSAGILFYVRESDATIEMISVGADGRLWVMSGPLGGETRTTREFETADGGRGRLRFTRFAVEPDRFESRMEYTEDGGTTWKPGNHQTFRRVTGAGRVPPEATPEGTPAGT